MDSSWMGLVASFSELRRGAPEGIAHSQVAAAQATHWDRARAFSAIPGRLRPAARYGRRSYPDDGVPLPDSRRATARVDLRAPPARARTCWWSPRVALPWRSGLRQDRHRGARLSPLP